MILRRPCCSRRGLAVLITLLSLLSALALLLPAGKSPEIPPLHDKPTRHKENRISLDILLPGTLPALTKDSPDSYLCTAHRLKNSSTLYVVGFEPRGVGSRSHNHGSSTHLVHHMLLAACDQLPAGYRPSIRKRWNCGSMSIRASNTIAKPEDLPMDMCASGLRYLYAYAMDATPLHLPEGVAFPVGGVFGGAFLVLQVHYTLNPGNKSQHLQTGIRLSLLPAHSTALHPPKRLAGVHLSATSGLIPPRSVAHLSVGCPYTGDFTLHPFAFRVHTHRLGRVVSVYRLLCRSSAGNRENTWSLIGRANPQMMQAFYPVNSTGLELTSGDCVAAACVMENSSDRLVRIGPSADDEMCNAYVMYWYLNQNGQAGADAGSYGCISKGDSDLWVEAPEWVLKLSTTVPGTDRYLMPNATIS